jgi:hypothetical protein
MYRLGLLSSTLILVSATIGRGQTPDKPSPPKAPPAALFLRQGSEADFITRFEKNGDGALSRDEVPPFLAKSFEQVDTNKDGKLDRAEIEQLRRRLIQRFGSAANKASPGQAAPDFDALDRNADGRLTRDELKGTPFASRFDEIDTNHAGQIDRLEFEEFLKRQAAKGSK